VLKTWVEDFVDEDTGEVVSIERNEVIIDVKLFLKMNISMRSLTLVPKLFFFIKITKIIDFAIIYNTLQKDPCNSEKEAVLHIYRQLRNSEPPDEATAEM
jgi:DNA-directed RNA polymerase subunit beta